MTSYWKLFVTPVACAAVCSAGSVGAREAPLYGGESFAAAGVTVSSWGSGSASENSQNASVGSKSIQIQTPGLFAGAFVDFAKPVDIAEAGTVGKYDYLELMIKFKSMTQLGLTNPNRTPTANGDYTPLPADYYGNYYADEIPKVPKIRKIRIVLTAQDGRSVAHTGLVVAKPMDEEGWYSVSLPLAAFGITPATKGFDLKRIAISADYPDTFWVGEMRVITDDSRVFVEGMDEQTVATYDLVIMQGKAEAGRTSLIYSWDFNASDGIQEDGEGPLVQVSYKKAGTYTVTLTAKDPDGIKEPATTKSEIVVE